MHNTVVSATLQRFDTYRSPTKYLSRRDLIDELEKCFEEVERTYMNLNWDGEAKGEPAIGIDLGTVNSVVAVFFNGKVQIIRDPTGTNNTPSYISFQTNGTKRIGRPAQKQSLLDPANALYDVKRLIGRKFDDPVVQDDMKQWPFQVKEENNQPRLVACGKTYKPEEVSAVLLSEFKEEVFKSLRCPIRKAVITVPAYFNDDQRRATLEAGKLGGLEILNILSEPTAAAIAYKLQRYNEQAKHVVVFDLGGGTFDVAVLNTNNQIEILAIGGNSHLGGEDFDIILMNHCLKKFEEENTDLNNDLDGLTPQSQLASRRRKAKLLVACEEAKKQLSFTDSAQIVVDSFAEGRDLDLMVTKEEFEGLVEHLFQEMVDIVDKTLKDAGVKKEDVDDIVMVGGATRIPKLQKMISKYFKGKTLNLYINPDEAVAYGAAMQAALMNGEKEAEKMFHFKSIYDVTPFSYGIEANIDSVSGRFSKVIEKNTKYPTEKVELYLTSRDNQDTVTISIYQGEDEVAKNNFFLGQFILGGIPPAPKGQQRIKVTMKITEYGILRVEAKCQSTGGSAFTQLTVTPQNNEERKSA